MGEKPQRNKPRRKNPPKRTELVEIGQSPVPGLTLRHIVRGFDDCITRIK
jgi:hypothetical protein